MKKKFIIKTLFCCILFLSFAVFSFAETGSDTKKLMDEALKYAQSGDLIKAKETYDKAVKIDPALKSTMHLNMGMGYMTKLRYQEAASEFQAACATQPSNIMYRYNLAQAQQLSGDLNGSILTYKKMTEIDPKLDWAFFNMGVLLNQSKKLDEAIDAFKKVEKLNPSLVSTYLAMADVYIKMDVLEAAIQSYEKAIKIEPNNYEAIYNLGLQYLKIGKPDQSAALFQKAVSINPNFAEGYANLGSLEMQKKQPEKAIPFFSKALSINPNLDIVLINMATAYRDIKQYDKAIEYAKKVKSVYDKNRAEMLIADIKELQKKESPNKKEK